MDNLWWNSKNLKYRKNVMFVDARCTTSLPLAQICKYIRVKILKIQRQKDSFTRRQAN